MPYIDKSEVEVLAFRRYKSGETYEKSIWYLAELSATINKNIKNGYDIKPLETDNLVLLIRENVDGKLIQPSEDEIKKVSEIIYNEHPPKSQLDWYIAEKTLLLREIENIIKDNRKKSE